MTIGKIGGADADGRTVGYYTAAVARGRDDYYTGKGEAAGQWFGAGAGALGLVGEVDADDFRQVVMDAVAPRTGSVLRQLVDDRPVRGFDMTFSAPKSASLLFFLGRGDVPGAVRQAHDEAVAAALGYMEREACVVRAGKAGRAGKSVGGGFVGGLFRHRTSRALDPQLHTHAVVANFAERTADGRRVALDARVLYQQAKTGGFVHQTPTARPANRVRSTGAPLGWIPVNRRGSITCTTVPILPWGSVAGRAVCASTSTAGWESSRRRRATPRHSEASNHASRWTARARCCSAGSPRDAAATCRSSHHTAEPRAVTGSQKGTRAATSA